jgi:hypothetical protein
MQTVTAELLKKSVAFTVTFQKWGNRRAADLNQVQTDGDKSRLSMTKRLIVADEYDAIIQYQSEVYNRCVGKPVPRPSFLRKGLYLVGLGEVDRLELMLKEAATRIRSELVPALATVFEQRKEEARVALNGQFNEQDYPTIDSLPNRFGVTWNWIAFTVPEGLPPELRATEQAKLEQQFKDAGDEIVAALRTGFQDLITHAVERLQRKPGEKAKTFKDSTIENINEFIATFSARNLMDDRDLAALVEKAKEILKGTNTQWLRESYGQRAKVADGFAEIKTTIDKMIVDKPVRKFDFEE